MIAIAIGIAIAGFFIGLGLTRLAESLQNRKININIYHKDEEDEK